jgi:hypothetical protein
MYREGQYGTWRFNLFNSTRIAPKYLRIAGILAVISALALTVADYLLEFSPEFRISNTIIEPFWLTAAPWRFSLSIFLAAFFLPFYIGGYWMVYRALRPSHPKIGMTIFLMGSYGIIMGSPIVHTVVSLFPVIYKSAQTYPREVVTFAEELITDQLFTIIMPMFITHYFLAFIIPPLLFFGAVIGGKSRYPLWTAFLNPFFIAILLIGGLFIWPEIFMYLTPGSINKGMVVFFLLPTILLWNGERETL